MRRKIITLLLAATLTSSMLLTSCGNQENTSNTQTSINTQQTDDSQKADDTANNEASTNTAVSETPDMILTADTEITDKDLQEIYTSVKENITTEYLEPNGISASEFSWPASDSESWDYFGNLYNKYATNLHLNLPVDNSSNSSTDNPDEKIMDAAFTGIINWINTKGTCDDEYFTKLFMEHLSPFNDVLSSNVTFE